MPLAGEFFTSEKSSADQRGASTAPLWSYPCGHPGQERYKCVFGLNIFVYDNSKLYLVIISATVIDAKAGIHLSLHVALERRKQACILSDSADKYSIARDIAEKSLIGKTAVNRANNLAAAFNLLSQLM